MCGTKSTIFIGLTDLVTSRERCMSVRCGAGGRRVRGYKLSKRRVRVWTVRYVVAPEGEDGEVCGVA